MRTDSPKDADEHESGLFREFGLTMSDEGITPQMLKAAVSDPIRKATVGAALRGEIAVNLINPQDWINREIEIGMEMAKLGLPGYLPGYDQALIEKAAEMGVGACHRFIPTGLHRLQLLEVSGYAGIKLYNGNAKIADYNEGENIPTKACLFLLDYASLSKPTDAEHRPFMCDYDQHWTWATEMGGNGFTTAEKTIYTAVLRPFVELGYIPFMGSGFRCVNACDSASLGVSFNADVGLRVNYCGRIGQYWDLSTVPELSKELVP